MSENLPQTEIPPTQEQPVVQEPLTTELHVPKKAKFTKKRILMVLIVLLIAGGAFLLYNHFHKKTPVTSSSASNASAAQQTAKADSVVYYSKDKEGDPYTIYLRPATGGDRKATLTLSGKVSGVYNSIGSVGTRGQNVIFTSDDGIYASQDGGQTFKNIYKLDPAKISNNQAVTSMKFSNDGKKIVFAFMPGKINGKSSNTVKTMDLDGQNVADLHTFDNIAGVFVYSYDAASQQLIYATGCYFCDGGPGYPHVMDLKTNADKQLVTVDTATQVFNSVVASPDGKKLLYYIGVNDKELSDQTVGIGWQGGPPYKVFQVDVATAQATQMATVGSLHEKDASGKFKLYSMMLGYTNDAAKPYYTADNKLFVSDSATPSLLFEATKNILQLPYVASDELFPGVDSSSGNNSDYTLYRYETATKKSTTLFQGDVNTRIIGVTTK